jgi:hypothetical protein
MNRIKVLVSLVLVSILGLSTTGNAFNEIFFCEGRTTKVTAITAKGYQSRTTIFNIFTNGALDPTPILSTTVNVEEAGCLIAHFSAKARPTDNYINFQVRITGKDFNGEPMEGHMIGVAGTATPVITDPEETNLNAVRVVSHTFFKRVPPGEYTVEVLMAGGNNIILNDSSQHPGVWDPVLVLQYN